MQDLVQEIQSGKYRKIVIFSGAGISVAAGILPFRGSNGIYTLLNLKSEAEINKVLTNQDHPLLQQQIQIMLNAQPTAAHNVALWLQGQGWLKRVYTQNVDSLYQKAGLADDLVVEVHGSYAKNNIVLFGDRLPLERIEACMYADQLTTDVDLLLVMGTSLTVSPFDWFTNIVPKSCHRIYINRDSLIYDHEREQFVKSQFGKICKQRISMKNLWYNHHKYQQQTLLTGDDIDVQDFCNRVME